MFFQRISLFGNPSKLDNVINHKTFFHLKYNSQNFQISKRYLNKYVKSSQKLEDEYKVAVPGEDCESRENALGFWRNKHRDFPLCKKTWLNLLKFFENLTEVEKCNENYIEEAWKIVGGFLKYDYGSVASWIAGAKLYRSRGSIDDAHKFVQKALKFDPTSMEALCLKAQLYFDEHKFVDALSAIESFLEIYPDFPQAKVLKAKILVAFKNYDQAVKCLEEAYFLAPEWMHSLIYYANIKKIMLDEIKTKNEDIFEGDGNAKDCQEKKSSVIMDKLVEHIVWDNFYKKSRFPQSNPSFYSPTYAYMPILDYIPSLEVCNVFISKEPFNFKALIIKARHLELSSRYDQVINCLELARNFDPTLKVSKWLARLKYQKKRFEDSLEIYEQILLVTPNDIEIWFSKALVLEELNRFEEALKCYDIVSMLHEKQTSILTEDTVYSLVNNYKKDILEEDINNDTNAVPINNDKINKDISGGVVIFDSENNAIPIDLSMIDDLDDFKTIFSNKGNIKILEKTDDNVFKEKSCNEFANKDNKNDLETTIINISKLDDVGEEGKSLEIKGQSGDDNFEIHALRKSSLETNDELESFDIQKEKIEAINGCSNPPISLESFSANDNSKKNADHEINLDSSEKAVESLNNKINEIVTSVSTRSLGSVPKVKKSGKKISNPDKFKLDSKRDGKSKDLEESLHSEELFDLIGDIMSFLQNVITGKNISGDLNQNTDKKESTNKNISRKLCDLITKNNQKLNFRNEIYSFGHSQSFNFDDIGKSLLPSENSDKNFSFYSTYHEDMERIHKNISNKHVPSIEFILDRCKTHDLVVKSILGKSRCLKKLNRLNEAQEVIKPLNTVLHTLLEGAVFQANLLFESNQFEEAISFIENGINNLPANLNTKDLFYIYGKILMIQGKLEAALEKVDIALNLEKRVPDIWKLKEELLIQMGRFEEASKVHEDSLKWNIHYWLEKMETSNDIDESFEACNQALKFNPDDFQALFKRSTILKTFNRLQEATDDLKRLISLNPRSFETWISLAENYLNLKEYDLSLKSINRALGIDPSNTLVHVMYIRWCINQKKYFKAFEYSEKLNVRVDDSLLSHEVDNLKIIRDEIEQVGSSLEQALQIDPNYWAMRGSQINIPIRIVDTILDLYYQTLQTMTGPREGLQLSLINYLRRIEKYQESYVYFERALALDPTNFVALEGKARIMCFRAQFNEAYNLVENAIAYNSKSKAANNLRDTLINKFSKFIHQRPRKITRLRKALAAVTSTSHKSAQNLIKVLDLFREGKIQSALSTLTHVLNSSNSFKNNKYAWKAYAQLLLLESNLDAAFETIERALIIDPYYSEAWIVKGKVLAKKNNLSHAKNCFEVAKEILLKSYLVVGSNNLSEETKVNGSTIRIGAMPVINNNNSVNTFSNIETENDLTSDEKINLDKDQLALNIQVNDGVTDELRRYENAIINDFNEKL